MHLSSALAVAALARSCLAASGFLQLDVHRSAPRDRHLYRRDNTVNDVTYQNVQNKQEYLINITIGTPGQKLAVTLDTGSSDLWLPASSSKLCKTGKCDYGSFDSSKSSTYKVVEKGTFNISYVTPGDFDAGNWATDTVIVGGSPPINQAQFGLASQLADQHGVMGVGYAALESTNDFPEGVYPTVLEDMVAQGLISRKAYSLYLNDYRSANGAILFGGVDSTKYTGDLIGLPIQTDPVYGIYSFQVTLTNITFTDHTGLVTQLSPPGYSAAVLLDSGTSFTALDAKIFNAISAGFGAVDDGSSNYIVPCSYANAKGSINYSFGGIGGPTITVPISQVIGEQYYPNNAFQDKSGGCNFGFAPPLGGGGVLGDTFLRSVYVVLDIDNNMAALAQAKENQTDTSSIIAIPHGTSIPGVSITATATGTQLPPGQATLTGDVPNAAMTSGGSMFVAGTPTFNLGISQVTSYSASGSSSSSGAAHAAAPTAALLGLGLLAGVHMAC